MRQWRVAILLVAAAGGVMVSGQTPTQTVLLPLIPRPASVRRGAGILELDPISSRRLREFCSNDRLGGQPWVADMSRPMTTAGRNVVSKTPPLRINVLTVMKEYGEEGYGLTIAPEGIVIESRTPAGAFYGAQTLCQMIPAERVAAGTPASAAPIALPSLSITDSPRYKWRGMHLDVSRHFFTKDEIKRYIDLLARFKMNVFHWHLTDDGGWRIEIKKYPRLTEIGAWRKPTPEVWSQEKLSFPGAGSGGPLYGGFYTQADVRDVVAYASARQVTVVPEIELPGHCIPALVAYPELACANTPPMPDRAYPSTVMCPGKDSTFAFIDAVLDEVTQLFPSKHIHIGGDEVDRQFWTSCPHCQARMKAEGLTDPAQLQSYTIKRVEKMLSERGRTLVGWDEILDGGLAPNAVVMSWRGVEGGVTAAKAGHAVVMSPASHCYFDYPYGTTSTEQVYGFDPTVSGLAAEDVARVLGGQGNVWTESMTDFARVETMILPRMLALSEVLWSPPAGRSYREFEGRLNQWYQRFEVVGASYYMPPPAAEYALVTFTGQSQVTLAPPAVPGVAIRYTVDGTEPTAASPAYSAPLPARGDVTVTAAVFGPTGKLSESKRIAARAATPSPGRLVPGLSYSRYTGRTDSVRDIAAMKPDTAGVQPDPNVGPLDPGKPFAVVWTGFLRIPREGAYTITVGSDDGSALSIRGVPIVDNDGLHAYGEQSGRAWLTAGDHPIEVRYFNGLGDRALSLFIEGPGLSKQRMTSSMLYYRPGK